MGQARARAPKCLMERWVAARCRGREGERHYLTNRSATLIKIKRRLRRFSLEGLLLRLQELDFPLKYTNGLDRIFFTVLAGTDRGFYFDNQIWVDVSNISIDLVVDTFIHEVAHHVDEQEVASDGMELERKNRYKHLRDPYSKKNDSEYWAVGFERFYSGDRSDRRRMRLHNPRLFRAIQRLHDQYKSKR